jgi:hypothetical protein
MLKALKVIAAATVLAGSMAVATSAHAQFIRTNTGDYNYHAEVVNDQIRKVIDSAYSQGFNQIIVNARSQLPANGEPMTVRVWLQAGVDYRFAARCDGDCRDVDLVLRDRVHNEITADRDMDDTPSFTGRVLRTGEYYLTVELANCAARTCQVGAVVLAQ